VSAWTKRHSQDLDGSTRVGRERRLAPLENATQENRMLRSTSRTLVTLSVTVTVTVLAVVATTALAAGWHTVGRGSAGGDFAIATADGDASHPSALAVSVRGGGISGMAIVTCDKGISSIGSKTTNFSGSGLHRLKFPMSHPASCNVVASVSGSGRLSLKILAR
jgi:hypothetical protein